MSSECYAVLGAGGGTGKACVETLLQQGFRCKAVVRDPEKARSKGLGALETGPDNVGGRLEVVRGDVTQPAGLRQALAGCAGCIFAASGSMEVDCQGVKNVADALVEVEKSSGSRGSRPRVVLVSSGMVTPARRWNPVRLMLNNIVSPRGLMDAKWQGEELLRKSGASYTIVRPGGRLNDKPAGQELLATAQGDQSSGHVSRADVAAVCVAALKEPALERVTFELEGKGSKQVVPPLAEQLKSLFNGLKADA